VTTGRRLAPLAALALAACTSTAAPPTTALFSEPSALAVFRGVTTASAGDPGDPIYPYRPYVAVANAGANSLSILDPLTDTVLPAPVQLRPLVYPAPGRPLLLASADLGDRKPDLLVAVSAGELPSLGGSRIAVFRTWSADGAIAGEVELPGDVLALVALPFDPVAPGRAKLAAALAGERIAVVTFSRSSAGDGTAIDVAAAQASVATSAPLGFQPVDLAALQDDPARVFAASPEPLPGGVLGVAEIDVAGTPVFARALDARAPTRLVAALRLAEAAPLSTALDPSAFDGQPAVPRVYAVLDESGCGVAAPIACGIAALDPVTGALALDPLALASSVSGTMQAPFRAPIAVLGRPLALGATLPPALPPDASDPTFAGTYMRLATSFAPQRATTGTAAVASTDGTVTFVDLGRWEAPSTQSIHASIGAGVTSTRPAGATGNQWLVLERAGVTIPHVDPTGLASAVGTTAGYTPGDRWTVTREGVLPALLARRAEAGNDGAPWLAMQVTGDAGTTEVVRLYDPVLGVHPGDTVVIEPVGLGTCTAFEATVADLLPPDAARPGGAVRLARRLPTNPAFDRCLDLIAGPVPGLRASIRAGGYLLVRGSGSAALHVGRPDVGVRFEVLWEDEEALAASCPLPPAVPWPAAAPACDPACRAACEALQRARLARRVGYLSEAPAARTGPALAFTLALEAPGEPVPRDLALQIVTVEGRNPFRVGASSGSPVGARAVVRFDRSPWAPAAGVRFFVPYTGGVVVDSTPTIVGGSVSTIR
jgi:hypothetical protein